MQNSSDEDLHCLHIDSLLHDILCRELDLNMYATVLYQICIVQIKKKKCNTYVYKRNINHIILMLYLFTERKLAEYF